MHCGWGKMLFLWNLAHKAHNSEEITKFSTIRPISATASELNVVSINKGPLQLSENLLTLSIAQHIKLFRITKIIALHAYSKTDIKFNNRT